MDIIFPKNNVVLPLSSFLNFLYIHGNFIPLNYAKSFAIQEALIQDETDRHYDEALVYIDVYNFIANLDFKNVKANKYVRSLFFQKTLSHVKKIYNSNMSCILAPNALNSKALQP